MAEVNTYVNQASSSGYSSTSNEYRRMTVGGSWSHWEKLGLTHTTDYTMVDAYQICKEDREVGYAS